MVVEKCWYAVYTKPRWEKKVVQWMQEAGIEVYCPLNKVRRKWSDRYKIVEEPLFKSYVFVHVSQDEMTNVRYVNGVVNFVYWNGKPARIRDEEITIIRKFLNEYMDVTAEPYNIKEHEKVMIKSGLFMENHGVVTKVMNNRVEVLIESLGYKLKAIVDKSNIEAYGT
ncbi:MAG: transcription termination/antitermination protein NusG [Chitinophagaceae bacterium]